VACSLIPEEVYSYEGNMLTGLKEAAVFNPGPVRDMDGAPVFRTP
jgi:hypothetical protein